MVAVGSPGHAIRRTGEAGRLPWVAGVVVRRLQPLAQSSRAATTTSTSSPLAPRGRGVGGEEFFLPSPHVLRGRGAGGEGEGGPTDSAPPPPAPPPPRRGGGGGVPPPLCPLPPPSRLLR